jgi:hypothetical protein
VRDSKLRRSVVIGDGRGLRAPCRAPALLHPASRRGFQCALLVAGLIGLTGATVTAGTAAGQTTTTNPSATTSTTAPAPASSSTSSTSTTTSTTTPTSAPSSSPQSPAPGVISPPLVTISTMAKEGATYGILINSHRTTPIPCSGQSLTDDNDQECFYPDPTPNSWVQVLVLHRVDLSFVSNQDFACPQATQFPQEAKFDMVPGGGGACTSQLSSFIGSLNAADLVVASNQPGTPNVQPPAGLAAVLASVGSNHGIGADATWYNSPNHGANLPPAVRGTVSVIGVPGWAPGTALSQSSAPDGPVGAGAMVSDVAVDYDAATNLIHYSPYSYDAAVASTDANLVPLSKVLFQKATPWPDRATGCPGSTETSSLAALSRLGSEAGLGPDPRAQYYSEPVNYVWGPRLDNIRAEKFASLSPPPTDFSECEFNWAKDELVEEIDDVQDVNNYTSKLAAPYRDAKGDLWATFNDALAHVSNSVGSNTAAADTVGAVLVAILAIAAAVPASVVGPAIPLVASIMGATYSLASKVSTYFGNQASQSFGTTASGLAVQLVKRLDGIQEEIEVRWRNILVADYGKLRVTALCSTSKPQCHDDAKGWSFGTVDDVTNFTGVLEAGLEREMYEKLVPDKYPLLIDIYQWEHLAKRIDPPHTLAEHPGKFCGYATPFPDGTATFLRGYAGDDEKEWDHSKVYVLTDDPDVTPGSNGKFASMSKDTADRMFGAVTGADGLAKGGLGISWTDFTQAAYFTKGRVSTFADKFPVRNFAWLCYEY